MKRWLRGLAMAACTGVMLAGAGLAEISDWAQAQESAETQVQWAEAQGDTVNLSAQAEDITRKCAIKVSEGDKSKLTDERVSSNWTYSHDGAWIGVKLPDGVTAGAIRIEWMFDPTGFELTEYDEAQKELRRRTQADTFPNIYTMFSLLPETRLVQLKMTAKDQQVGRLALYSEGVLPSGVQTWLPPVEKADMMVVSTHQDDEVIFLGGTIPYSDVVCNRPTITVYMANCTRERRREALECLWEMGSRTYPEFVNLKDEKVDSIKAGVKLWGGKDNILKEIVQRIRRYKPEVIVTQDLNGEYGHNQHKIVARAMKYAVEAAADPTQFPDSYNIYGSWQVKKLYIHLLKENRIHMDWLTPQPALGGLTLLKVAQNGMAKHASQTKYFSVKDGGQYDNAVFGLQLSAVGEDVAKNDFFENIPENASADYLATAPTPAPTPEPTPEPTAEPVETPVPEDEGAVVVDAATPEATVPAQVPAQTARERGGGPWGALLIAAGVALLGVGGWYILGRKPQKPAARRKKMKK